MLRICSAEIIEPVLATVKRIQRVSSFVKEDKRTVIQLFHIRQCMVIRIRHIIKREMNVFLPGRCKE